MTSSTLRYADIILDGEYAIITHITQDGPISNFGHGEIRPDTMIQFELTEDIGTQLIPLGKTGKESGVPFMMAAGGTLPEIIDNIGWHATMWHPGFEGLANRTKILDTLTLEIESQTRSYLNGRDLPRHDGFVKENAFYHLFETKIDDDATVWLKRRFNRKDKTFDSRWSFVKKSKKGGVNIEEKVTLSQTTAFNEPPMTFEEALALGLRQLTQSNL